MAVIFWDFDGTLVHSNSLWSSSVYNALKQTDSNTTVQFNDIRKCMAVGFTWHTPDNDYSKMTGKKWWDFMVNKIYNDYISLGVDKETAVTAANKVPDIIKNIDNYILYDDAVDTLKKSIENGNVNVLLSNNYPDLIDVMEKLHLTGYFDKMIVSACEGYDKPRQELFDLAKSFYPDENYIMIGDSVSADIIGGNNAGMTTVLVHNGYNAKADYCFDNLKDINRKYKIKGNFDDEK